MKHDGARLVKSAPGPQPLVLHRRTGGEELRTLQAMVSPQGEPGVQIKAQHQSSPATWLVEALLCAGPHGGGGAAEDRWGPCPQEPMSGVGVQEGTGKPPSTRASQVGEVLEDSEQGDILASSSRVGMGSAMWGQGRPLQEGDL